VTTMPRRTSRNPTFWFVPGMLVCVAFITGLCLFFIRRQLNSEEDRLHQMERFTVEQTQQLFRRDLEDRWQRAASQFPEGIPEYSELRAWDHELDGRDLGFCLDNSGLPLYPAYQVYSSQDITAREGLGTSNLLQGRKASGALSAATLTLEKGEITIPEIELQARLIDGLLRDYSSGAVPLTPFSLSWLTRLEEQCRRRNDQEAWLRRELELARLVKQTQFAEKFLARMNLLLRRHLYNPARASLPRQYLTSDPSDDPTLVVCKFVDRSPLGIFGVVINLEEVASKVEKVAARSAWLPEEVQVRIHRESLLQAEALIESRILDPSAPQYVVQATPKDSALFRHRAWQKNLLYLATVLLSAFAFALVLFFGNRALKEQERLSKLRTDFLTNVSHELKTPLTAIRLHAEALERIVPPAAVAGVETIIGEADRLGLLIRDVLEFTRLENDKKKFLWEAVDLVTVIQESVRLFSQQLGLAGFELLLDLPDSLILERADRDALKQIATNLISNSVKFSPERKVLKIRLHRNGERAIWEVEDCGLGIPSKDLPHVFEKFYRGANLDPAISGTGLGLTLCKAFVEAHGGDIHIKSTPDEGSRFIITLPVGEARD
jgi:signal transduction histidine kinase